MPNESSSLDLHEGSNLTHLNLPTHGMEMMSEFSLKGDHSVVDASIVDESSIVDASVVDSSLLPQLQEPHHQQLSEYRLHSSSQHNSPKNAIEAIVNHHHSHADSHAHSTETTTIDGVVYNSRGYEVCGQLNQHNKPCQRIGKCPFHTTKDLKKSPTAEQSPPISVPEPPLIEKKDKTPMKTPYKQGWTKDEHVRFLNGLQIHGKGAWKEIALIVNTRTPTQIQSHAQKYYLRQKQPVKNKRSIHDITIEDVQDSMDASIRAPPHKSPHVTLVPNGSSNPVNINNRPPLQYSYTIQTHSPMYQNTQPMPNNDQPLMYFSRQPLQGPMVDQNQYSSPQLRPPQGMQAIHMQSMSMGNTMPQMQPMSGLGNPMSPLSSMQPVASMQAISPMQGISPMQSMQPLQTIQSIQSMQSMPSAYSHIGTHSHLPSINQVSAPTQLPSMHYNWYQSPYTSYSPHLSSGPLQNQMMQNHSEERHSLPSVRHDDSHKDYWNQQRSQSNHGGNDSPEEGDDNALREKRNFSDFLTHDDHREKSNRQMEDEDLDDDDKDEDEDDESNQFLVAEGDD